MRVPQECARCMLVHACVHVRKLRACPALLRELRCVMRCVIWCACVRSRGTMSLVAVRTRQGTKHREGYLYFLRWLN